MDDRTAQEVVEDVKARRELWDFLWKAGHGENWPAPTPPPDEMVQADLRRILLPRGDKERLTAMALGAFVFGCTVGVGLIFLGQLVARLLGN